MTGETLTAESPEIQAMVRRAGAKVFEQICSEDEIFAACCALAEAARNIDNWGVNLVAPDFTDDEVEPVIDLEIESDSINWLVDEELTGRPLSQHILSCCPNNSDEIRRMILGLEMTILRLRHELERRRD